MKCLSNLLLSKLDDVFIIGKYPSNCFASCLFLCHVGIFPSDIYIGCNWLFPNVSQLVASEYKIIDNIFAPIGKLL